LASLNFTIDGDPVAKGRPRFMTLKLKTGQVMTRAYTPKKTETYEDIVRWHALEARNAAGLSMLDGVPLELEVRCVLTVPASWSRVKQQRALSGLMRPIGRPDLDNYVKAISDALNGVVYRDDSAIWTAQVSKVYGETAKTEITLTWDADAQPTITRHAPLPLPFAEPPQQPQHEVEKPF
jgi:Holliday junction resolvase RusA-like endonuclease